MWRSSHDLCSKNAVEGDDERSGEEDVADDEGERRVTEESARRDKESDRAAEYGAGMHFALSAADRQRLWPVESQG